MEKATNEINIAEAYFKMLNEKESFKYCIIGLDPYPNGATGIPFMKEDWEEFSNKKYSAYNLFYGLGFDLDNVKDKLPVNFYYTLIDNGFAFLNLSYSILKDKDISRKNELILEGFAINWPIIKKSNKIVIVSKSGYDLFQKNIKEPTELKAKTTVVFHPKARIGRNDSRAWWFEKGELLDKIKV